MQVRQLRFRRDVNLGRRVIGQDAQNSVSHLLFPASSPDGVASVAEAAKVRPFQPQIGSIGYLAHMVNVYRWPALAVCADDVFGVREECRPESLPGAIIAAFTCAFAITSIFSPSSLITPVGIAAT